MNHINSDDDDDRTPEELIEEAAIDLPGNKEAKELEAKRTEEAELAREVSDLEEELKAKRKQLAEAEDRVEELSDTLKELLPPIVPFVPSEHPEYMNDELNENGYGDKD
jgi:seryl-tRNA synthetase